MKLAVHAVALLSPVIVASSADAQVRDHRSGSGSSNPGGVSLPNGMKPQPGPGTGWPHATMQGFRVACDAAPAPDEVIVATDPNFRAGACAVLRAGFYPRATNTGVPNDSIRAIKVGAKVRARAFKDSVFAGTWKVLLPGSTTTSLAGLDRQISSMRIEPADRSVTCNDLRSGEIALFESTRMQGDCVVLPTVGAYYGAEEMGIENDSISSIVNMSARSVVGNRDTNGGSKSNVPIAPWSKIEALSADSFGVSGPNDKISSIIVK